MDTNHLCTHRHRRSFRAYLAGFSPIGEKTCDLCGQKIHLTVFWRALYIVTCLIGPSPVILVAIFGGLTRLFSVIPFIVCLLILIGSFCVQFAASWMVTRWGRYVLSKGSLRTTQYIA